VRSRRAGGTIFIELELGFDPEKTMREVHLTIERMTQTLEQEVAGSKVRVVINPPSSQEQPA
jgi:divalent metal cation (Fe/Co/Zn/Cd) transporter